MKRRLGRDFFVPAAGEKTEEIAKRLLGKYIVRRIGDRKIWGKIVETEVYGGPRDKACHAYGGKVTPRNKLMYAAGGRAYVYLIYGMHWQLNFITQKSGVPECVLVRALEVEGDDPRAASGPGKLCRFLEVDKSFHGEDVVTSKDFWLENRGVEVARREIVSGPRVNIDYAGPHWAKRNWRFYLKNNSAVSRK